MKRALGRFLLLGLLAGAGSAEATPVELIFRPVGGWAFSSSLMAEITLDPVGGEGAARQARTVSLGAASRWELPPRTTWQLGIRGEGIWVRPQVFFVGAEATAQPIEVLPAGILAGEIRLPPAAKLPALLSVRLRPSPGASKEFAEIEEKCPIDPRNRFRCTVPAGTFDLRLRVAGFVTQYRWGAAIPRNRILDAGILALRPGASVVGWIEAPERDFRFGDCTVELAPQVLGVRPTPSNVERRDSLRSTARPNSRGFFELAGMEAGSFALVVRHPGYAPARVSPLEVAAGTETEIKAVRLEPPAELTVEVSPPADSYGRPWRLELLQRGVTPDFYEPVKEGPPSAEGRWTVKDLAPGHFALAVNGSYRSRWSYEDFELPSGATTRTVRLPFVQVEGEVRIGDEPLMALLWFGGAHGATKIPAKSFPDGKFQVVLPETESKVWRVEVVNELENLRGVVPELKVEKAPGRDVARVTVVLPDTSVSGEVVDEQGRPVPGAHVGVGGKDFFTVKADEQGRFELRALEAGDWHLEGTAEIAGRSLTSDDIPIRVGREPVEGVKLVVREQVKLAGIVLGPAGQAVPGAYVYPRIEQEGAPLTLYPPATYTDVDGQFEMRLPAAAEGVQLTVYPPGFAVKTVRIDVRRNPSVTLAVSPLGGTVVLDFGREPSGLELNQLDLFGEYSLGPPSAWRQWAALFGPPADASKLEIPMLEPGRYTACQGVHSLTYRGGRPPIGNGGQCASGELGPNGTLTLRLPIPKAAPEPNPPGS
jgi:hypothetical protein